MVNIFALFSVVVLLLTMHLSKVNGDSAKIDPELLLRLENGETANVVVFFVRGVNPTLQLAKSLERTLNNRPQRNQQIIDNLRETADISQEGVIQMLSSRTQGETAGFSHLRTFWLGNKIFIGDANAETIKRVAEDPETLKIQEPATISIPQPEVEDLVGRSAEDSWGLAKIEVEAAWEELGGNRGEGVIVGSIDSGVQSTHEALRDNFVGVEYGWFDALENYSQPEDSHGHGTHVMGTLAGSHGIGVAPGAKWMACKGCNAESGCDTEAFVACMEWMACPHLPDGSNPDCSKAPHVISNSWSVPRGEDQYNEEILVWRELGIIPVFIVSNEGPGCDTTRPPGELPNVIGVGGTDSEDQLYRRSAIGYASDGGIKPDIVAPGVNIKSAGRDSESDSTYSLMGGTSMAAPFVAGVVALLKVRSPDLTYEQAYDFLTQNTDKTVTLRNDIEYCSEGNLEEYPNIYAGYGRLNALKAVQAQTAWISARRA